jgi:hypothetical protein
LIVFSPGKAEAAVSRGENPASVIDLDGPWEFELQPTSDNRFGDFHWPPTSTKIGAEVRQLWYCEGEHADGPWRKVTCSFGPQFIQSATLPAGKRGKPYEFSWRWGVENDPGHQGWHGLKEEVHDEFLAIGNPRQNAGHSPNVVRYEATKGNTYFSTAVLAPSAVTAYALTGVLKPVKIWLNGEAVAGPALKLKAGANPLVLEYNKPGRTYFVVSKKPAEEPRAEVRLPADGRPVFRPSNLAMRWWKNPNVLPFDIRTAEKSPVAWYRFVSPPGLRGMTVLALGKVQAWADGKPLAGSREFTLPQPSPDPVNVLLRIEQERGCYAGAALTEFIKLDCGPGRMALGDWSKNDGLLSYSGGAWYRKTVDIPAAKEVTLDLGDVVASAEVRVNGSLAGVKVSPPWTVDISRFVKPGGNRIEVLVCNTLANHYTTVPTRYRGPTTSGLLGPVKLVYHR